MKRLIGMIVAAALFILSLTACGGSGKKEEASSVPTEAATEYVITPAGSDEIQRFSEALVGSWSSYTKDGVAYTYDFDADGGVRYQKDGEEAENFTYTLENDRLTITTDKKSFVYQCSKDAVDMMAKLHNGEWQQLYANTEKSITDFNGYVYIENDILYLGSVCLCRTDSLKTGDEPSVVGEWLGAAGDKIIFGEDGSYLYIDNATEYNGTYTVDFENQKLTLILADNTTAYTKSMWGLDGRVFHIGKQYYFKIK